MLAPLGSGALLARTGAAEVIEMAAGDRSRVGALEVGAVHAEHDGRRGPGSPPAAALGYVVSGSRRAYFAGDTDLFPGMADIAPGLDVALLPIWGWGPTLGPGHLDPLRAAQALVMLRPRLAVPIHWGTYAPVVIWRAFRRSFLARPPHDFVRAARRLAPDVQVRVLAPGGSTGMVAGVTPGEPAVPGIERPRWARLVGRALILLAINAFGVYIGSLILPGIGLEGRGALIGVVLIAVLNALVYPTLARLVLPISALTLGLGSLVLSGAMIWLAGQISPDFRVDGLGWGIALSVIVTVVNIIGTTLLGIDDDNLYWKKVVQRSARKEGVAPTDVPGVLFLEIDGLAHDVLQRAMRNGHTPNLTRWLEEGSHRLIPWECDWSSQTGASQAGLLHGNNEDMPAFRWFEKERGVAMVSNHPQGHHRDPAAHQRRQRPAGRRRREPGQHVLGGRPPHPPDPQQRHRARARERGARLLRLLREPLLADADDRADGQRHDPREVGVAERAPA